MINLFQTQYNQTKLTPKKLNQEIRLFVKEKNIIKSTENQVWDKKVFIDLSKIEWINTSALVELILITENLIEHGIMVTVALPNKNMLSVEARNLKDHPGNKQFIEHAIKERRKARGWLYRLKIIQALSFEHQPNVIRSNIKVLDQFDKELFDQNPVGEESDYYKIHGLLDAEQKDIGEKYHVPLLWTKGYDYHSDYIKNILKERLDISHAQIISDIVINELVKNVNDHSSKKHGLFCAAVGKHNPTKVFKTDYYESDIPFFKRCNEGEYIIEIVFGDSGKGIIQTLNKNGKGKTEADLLRYSFDKWSTRFPYGEDYNSFIKRGTRGLYHVRRVVQNYDGMAAIRNSKFFAGFNDLTNDPINETKLQEFNGTLLTLRLLPGRGKTLSGRYYPTTKSSEMNASDCERLSIDVNNISEGLKLVGRESKRNSYKNFLISLDFSKLSNEKFSDKTTINADLRELLASLSNLRHPNVHIVYGFPANFYDTHQIEKIVDSVNEAIKLKREKNKYLVFDPIMIIGPMGSAHWAGVQDQKLVLFLNKLMETEELSLPIDYIDQEGHGELIEYIKQDAELFCIQNESIKLNFNKNASIEYFKKEIQTKIEYLVKKGDQERRILVTPHLKYVKGWFDINDIYKDLKNEYALTLYSLWHNHRFEIFKALFPDRLLKKVKKQDCSNEELDNIQRDLLKDNLKILVESEIDIPSGEMFIHLLDISTQGNLKILSDEEDNKKPRRNRLFDEDNYVIIITSVVSTKETAKKLIKSILRSNATPVCLLSLVDFSDFEFEKDQKSIKQWGNPVLFYSIITTKDLIASEPKKNVEYKSLIGNGNEKTPQNQSFYIEKELRKGILNSKSLHFSHIGKSNGRHFTFYFNAKRFLNEECRPNIWRKLKGVINEWYRSININLDVLKKESRRTVGTQTSVWYPDREYKKGYQGQGVDLSAIIKNGLKQDYNIDLDRVESTSRESTPFLDYDPIPETDKHKIIVDWGSITGESIEKLIYKTHKNGFKNILVCIFLNQLSDKKKAYLMSISTITSDFPLPEEVATVSTGVRQLELFEEKKPEQKKSNKGNPETKSFISNVRIEFIHDFPLTCYESDYECNVCALREDLEKYEIPNATLKEHAKIRRMALDIRPREITKYKPFDFYSRSYDEDDEKNIPLDEEFILRMFEFKTLLIYAQASTYWRLRTKLEFIGILKSLRDYKGADRINKSSEKENEIWVKLIKDCTDITNHFKLMFPEMYNSIKVHDYNIDSMVSRTHAMIYFLSVETSWIQKPPLSNVELRQMLSLISRAIIFNSNLKISTKNGKKDKAVVRVKYAAITVLRMADKKDFIENIFAILNNTLIEDIGSNSIIENVLFHINTFISKDYHAKHEDLIELKSILNDVEDIFSTNPSYNEWRDGLWYLKILVNNLRVRGIFRHYNNAEIVKSCLQSYKETFLHYRHSEVETKFGKLCFPVSTLNTNELNEYKDRIDELHKNWAYVGDTISNLYLLTLKSIPKIIASKWATNNDIYQIGKLNLKEKIGYDDEFSKLLKRIQEDRSLLMNTRFMENYNHQINLIRDYFIIHPNSTNTGKSARVFSFLNAIKSEYPIAFECAQDILSEKRDGQSATIGEIVKIDLNLLHRPFSCL